MKFFLLLITFIVSTTMAEAQRIRVNGDVKTKKEVPISGVLVMAFENGTMLRSNVSNAKGEYSFNIDRLKFDLLYYKPGLLSHTYTINNRLDKESQGFYKYVQMDDSLAETVVDLNVWLKRHHLAPKYIDSVYKEELRKIVPSDTAMHKSRRQIKQEALAEQKRFSNYQKTTDKETIDNQESDVTKVIIGPDTYEMITSEKGGKKYFKNDKPITEVTYKFETTRRYEGVLKSTKDVRKFDKYKPMEHVKGT